MLREGSKRIKRGVETNTMASSDLEFSSDILIARLLADKAFADRRSYNPVLEKMRIRAAIKAERG